MKISIITVIYNGEAYLKECIESIISQSHQDIEYIIVDGVSTDGTLKIVEDYRHAITHLVSEPDRGLYDAINKGILLASGDVVGILNADDMLADGNVIAQVAKAFTEHAEINAVYGDLNYIRPVGNQILRAWKSKQADKLDIAKGWMPAHPTLYIKKDLFEKFGNYALDIGTAADYDLILRYFFVHQIKAVYLSILMVNMRMGGVSNKNLSSLARAFKNDYKALKRNRIPNPIKVLFWKKLSKIIQYW
ncbi:glycosyl transferase family 2 [Pedobacter psychrotolerans]|uniref:Glycosyl transferase n=1 Tax=Pedobacter psychrotolerans TaxID=1843235 RepID=A0A4R2HNN6_9SPHI|nr:glycosyltransferase family 2 protein [Pedobacter psychrotolerans]TCO30824.1 glycosyl transferase family 2 [Pedobacter psychrotolerans]GGE44206.1 glycosyl transferase [Pedobacter psychrotolerans]